jgi:hypothetical protein
VEGGTAKLPVSRANLITTDLAAGYSSRLREFSKGPRSDILDLHVIQIAFRYSHPSSCNLFIAGVVIVSAQFLKSS